MRLLSPLAVLFLALCLHVVAMVPVPTSALLRLPVLIFEYSHAFGTCTLHLSRIPPQSKFRAPFVSYFRTRTYFLLEAEVGSTQYCSCIDTSLKFLIVCSVGPFYIGLATYESFCSTGGPIRSTAAAF